MYVLNCLMKVHVDFEQRHSKQFFFNTPHRSIKPEWQMLNFLKIQNILIVHRAQPHYNTIARSYSKICIS